MAAPFLVNNEEEICLYQFKPLTEAYRSDHLLVRCPKNLTLLSSQHCYRSRKEPETPKNSPFSRRLILTDHVLQGNPSSFMEIRLSDAGSVSVVEILCGRTSCRADRGRGFTPHSDRCPKFVVSNVLDGRGLEEDFHAYI